MFSSLNAVGLTELYSVWNVKADMNYQSNSDMDWRTRLALHCYRTKDSDPATTNWKGLIALTLEQSRVLLICHYEHIALCRICSFESEELQTEAGFMQVEKVITRANTGHAVLQSMPKPPKMRRRNGPTDGQTGGRLNGRTDSLTDVLCSN